MEQDTIAALVTAVGESSVGIIRLSGPDAVKIAAALYRGKSDFSQATTHTIHYGHVYDVDQDKIIDEALFLLMRGPRSFTGEDVVEIQCHGGMVVIQAVLQLVLRQGARLADPGEYSKRAFLNGRLDLAQAESIMDIVQAKTEKSLDLALRQLQGGLSEIINGLRAELLELIAFIQADIDYPDDDIERLDDNQQKQRVLNMAHVLIRILQNARKGQLLRDGIRVVIAGKPNVGKSSLMNALLQQSRAIVTDIPGTTRDIIEETLNLNGIPLKIVDTAGIRETENIVEKIGVQKAYDFLQAADLVLYVLDGAQGLKEQDRQLITELCHKQIFFLLNKSDLGVSDGTMEALRALHESAPVIQISALHNQGIDRLEEAIINECFAGKLEAGQEILVTNVRHIQLLEECSNHFTGFLSGLEDGQSADLLVIDLQNAWEKLGKITGETIEEDLLDQIFSKFCLGK